MWSQPLPFTDRHRRVNFTQHFSCRTRSSEPGSPCRVGCNVPVSQPTARALGIRKGPRALCVSRSGALGWPLSKDKTPGAEHGLGASGNRGGLEGSKIRNTRTVHLSSTLQSPDTYNIITPGHSCSALHHLSPRHTGAPATQAAKVAGRMWRQGLWRQRDWGSQIGLGQGRVACGLMGGTQQWDNSRREAGSVVWDNRFICGLTTCDQKA